MNEVNLEEMRAALTAGRRTDRLAERIAGSIGRAPRRLPSRTMLAIESVAGVSAIMAAVVVVTALIVGVSMSRPNPPASIISATLDGTLPSSREVYVAMTGLGGTGGEP